MGAISGDLYLGRKEIKVDEEDERRIGYWIYPFIEETAGGSKRVSS